MLCIILIIFTFTFRVFLLCIFFLTMLFVFSLYFSGFSILIFFTVEGDALLWHRNPFHSSPTNNTFVKTVLIIFNILTFSLFELLSVLAWVFFNKNYFTIFNTKLIKRFHRVKMVFWGICTVYID